MAQIQSFRELAAWQKAMTLAEDVYSASAALPPDERFGLTQALRRCAVSIPSNIVEGHRLVARHSGGTWSSRSGRSQSSQLELAIRLNMLQPRALERCESLAGENRRLLYALLRSLNPIADRRSDDRLPLPSG